MGTNTLPIVFNGGHYRLGGIDYENVYGIVIILDALGVKGIWKTKNPEKVLQNWNKDNYLLIIPLINKTMKLNIKGKNTDLK
jgi:hypothetical protein